MKRSDPYSTQAEDAKQSNVETLLDNKFDHLDSKLESLAHIKGSEWDVYKLLKIDLKGFTTKPERGSSWIPTPDKYNNAKCGLIEIKIESDNECFKWCVKYHQSNKEKHCDSQKDGR